MSTSTLEQRISDLEKKVAQLEDENTEEIPPEPWWKKHVGVFKESPYYEEAVRLGAEYRASQPNPVDNFDAITFEDSHVS